MDWKKTLGGFCHFWRGGGAPRRSKKACHCRHFYPKKSKTIDKKDKPAKSNRSIDQSQN